MRDGLDGGRRFIPADIVGVHTISLLSSSRVAHNHATDNYPTQYTDQDTPYTRKGLVGTVQNLNREPSDDASPSAVLLILSPTSPSYIKRHSLAGSLVRERNPLTLSVFCGLGTQGICEMVWMGAGDLSLLI